MNAAEARRHNDRLDRIQESQRAMVNRVLVRQGLANALAAAEWLHAKSRGVLDTNVSYSGIGEAGEPEFALNATWFPLGSSVLDGIETRTVSAGDSRGSMIQAAAWMLREFEEKADETSRIAMAAELPHQLT